MKSKTGILLIIVLAQFLCTSVWFAGNAIISDLIVQHSFPDSSAGHLTSAIQFGFIIGTLAYALLSISDRFSPSKVFFLSAVVASVANAFLALPYLGFGLAMVSRFLVGFFLAGIYPVGMKIAADHFDKSLGKSLGYLVGALVLGTAFPHLLKEILVAYPYSFIVLSTSTLAIIGGLLIAVLVPDGPYRKPSQRIDLKKTFEPFKIPAFRGAAFGYFGHMWELYAFYAFVPAIIFQFNEQSSSSLSVPLWSFVFIACGGLGCFLSGRLSLSIKAKNIATFALAGSGLMCLISPLLLATNLKFVFLIGMVFWGVSIAADSPMFSTLVAKNAQAEWKGTALTIVNCIGFAITIVSIQLITYLNKSLSLEYLFVILALGPIFGLFHLWRNQLLPKAKMNLHI